MNAEKRSSVHFKRRADDVFRPDLNRDPATVSVGPSPGNNDVVTDDGVRPGSRASRKMGSGDEGRPEPDAAEVESARLLANSARERLRAKGMEDQDIQRAADAYIALDLGEDTEDFVSWVAERGEG